MAMLWLGDPGVLNYEGNDSAKVLEQEVETQRMIGRWGESPTPIMGYKKVLREVIVLEWQPAEENPGDTESTLEELLTSDAVATEAVVPAPKKPAAKKAAKK
jgi:hypothetical protein